MVGFLVWYICAKKQGKQKLKAKLTVKRRKSLTGRMPELEGQSMEETRRILLERHRNVDGFLKSTPAQSTDQTHTAVEVSDGNLSRTESSRTHPSWIGVAITSSTPPNTPPLPRSNSQKSTKVAESAAPFVAHPPSLTPGFGPRPQPAPSSPMPRPLRPALKPAPIVTSPNLERLDRVSPLSPRAMFNAVSSSTTRVWKRASQALSPSAYQRAEDEKQSESDTPKRRTSKPRNPELEIGRQTDNGWNGRWI